MNIPHYVAMLAGRRSATIVDTADALLVVEPPDVSDASIGFMPGVTAAETVELQRALTAWLQVHRQRHRAWHDAYRERDPGGPRRWDAEAGRLRPVKRGPKDSTASPRTDRDDDPGRDQ